MYIKFVVSQRISYVTYFRFKIALCILYAYICRRNRCLSSRTVSWCI